MNESLRLWRISGPHDPVVGDGPVICTDHATVGRLSTSTHCLPHESVSRLHATIRRHDGRWTITDEGSTSGTFVNSLKLEPSVPAVLKIGDEVGVGPWSFRAAGKHAEPERTIALTKTSHAPLVRTPSTRLSALSTCIDRLVKARSERELAVAVVHSGIEGTGLRRGAVLKPTSDEDSVFVVAACEQSSGTYEEVHPDTFAVPSSLVQHALKGEAAVLSGERTGVANGAGESILEMEVHSAVCVPVHLDGRVASILYFDSRGTESQVADAASFCEDIAQVYALCLAHAAHAELLSREAAMHAELERARLMRDMLAPPPSASVGAFCVAHRTVPGLFVSGDLVDVIETPSGNPVVLFGDATGHGIGAGILASLVHAHLHALMSSGTPHARAITLTNTYVASRATHGAFVSIWAAELHGDGTLGVVDAGHGHWFIVRATGVIEPAGNAASLPLGLTPDAEFIVTDVHLGKGDRVIVYTDGVSEQRRHDGTDLGAHGVRAAVEAASSCEEDVSRVIAQAVFVAGERGVDDDATVASIEFVGP